MACEECGNHRLRSERLELESILLCREIDRLRSLVTQAIHERNDALNRLYWSELREKASRTVNEVAYGHLA